jgi:AP2 domain
MNRRLRSDNTSGFKGVSFDAESGKWRARIMVEGRAIAVGRYREILDAARAYDEAALVHHGEFAVLNLGPRR